MPKSKCAGVNIGTYLFGIDLPPFDNDDDLEHTIKLSNTDQIAKHGTFHEEFRFRGLGFSSKYAKKKEKKGLITMQALEIAKQEAIKDDCSAITIAIINTQSSMDAGANL
ncbi:hypothetical protein L7F22_066723 [Adiantum nelumboides]|nr:hypothetical protein [Adiantum nelumboides]